MYSADHSPIQKKKKKSSDQAALEAMLSSPTAALDPMILGQLLGHAGSGHMTDGTVISPVDPSNNASGGALPGKNSPYVVLPAGPPVKRKGATAANSAANSADDLFNQLLAMVSQSSDVGNVDYEQALAQSSAAIRNAYAADIGAIRSGNAKARKDTAKNRRLTEKAYQFLAKTYVNTGQRNMKQGQNLANAMTAQGQKNADILTNAASQQMQEQAALTSGLGIQDAFPEAVAESNKASQDAVAAITKEAATGSSSQLQYAGNQQRYMERGGQSARSEGTERSTQLLADLQDYLQANQDKINSLRGQRARDLASNQTSVMNSVAQANADAQKEQWDRLMQLAGLKQSIEKEQFDQNASVQDYILKLQNSQGRGRSSVNSMPGAENFANAQSFLSQLQDPSGTQLFDSFLNGSPMTSQQYEAENGQMLKMNPYKAMQLIEQQARKQGLSEQDIQLLRLAIYAQMGK